MNIVFVYFGKSFMKVRVHSLRINFDPYTLDFNLGLYLRFKFECMSLKNIGYRPACQLYPATLILIATVATHTFTFVTRVSKSYNSFFISFFLWKLPSPNVGLIPLGTYNPNVPGSDACRGSTDYGSEHKTDTHGRVSLNPWSEEC